MGTRPSRIGFLGGSFDPVHLGHLLLAQDAYEQMNLDRVIFVPAARAPLKSVAPSLGDRERLELLNVVIAGDSRFDVSTFEIDRGGVSYTVESVRAFRRMMPDAELFWIIGADQTAQLDRWHEIAELAQLISFIVAARPGYRPPAEPPVAGVRLFPIEIHTIDISSTEIRDRIAAGHSLKYLLPPEAVAEIGRRNYYRNPA